MRKWMAVGAIVFLTPWVMSLAWMQAAGQAAEAGREMRGADGELKAGDGPGTDDGAQDAVGDGRSDVAGDGPSDEVGDGRSDAVGDGRSDAVGDGRSDVVGDGPSDELVAAAARTERRILMNRDGISTYMRLEDYLPGVMVCQIDGDYELEALKCQAVIARTYIYRLMDGRTEIQEEELDLDYLGGVSGGAVGTAGMTIQEKEKLADSLERCRQAATETAGQVMKYEDRYILPLFHAVSAGRTRKGEEDYPYLQSVESRWDRDRENYRQSFSWTPAEFAKRVNEISDGTPLAPEQAAGQLQTVKKDDSGYMLEVKVGMAVYSGEQLQRALGLPSSCFSLENADGRIRAVTFGVGHGYGLSQAGADSMAAEGWSFQDILSYYYKNISLVTE